MLAMTDGTQHRKVPHLNQDRQWEIVSNVEKSLERLTTMMEQFGARMVLVEERQVDNQKPHWQAMGVMLAGVVTIGTILGYGINGKIDNVNTNLINLAAIDQTHQGDGHPENVIERIEGVKQVQANLREKLSSVVPRSEHEQKDAFTKNRFELDTARFKAHIVEADRAHAANAAATAKKFEDITKSLARSDDQIFGRIDRLENYLIEQRRLESHAEIPNITVQ